MKPKLGQFPKSNKEVHKRCFCSSISLFINNLNKPYFLVRLNIRRRKSNLLKKIKGKMGKDIRTPT